MKIIFMGTPTFAVPALEALISAGHEVCAVYCQPPKAVGRGHHVQETPVHKTALVHHIPVFTPLSLKTLEAQNLFAKHRADVAVVVAYGLLLPRAILEVPRLGCMNIHGSLLPRWRGAAPVHRALLAGDSHTGIAIMQMDEGLDTGPILLEESLPIGSQDTTDSLMEALSHKGARLMVEALERAAAGTLTPRPQPQEGVTYASKISKEEGWVDWSQSASYIERSVRALSPWPGVFFSHGQERLKITDAQVESLESSRKAPGTVLSADLTIACGEGVLRITHLQQPGKAAMATKDFLNGTPIPVGSVFLGQEALFASV